MQDSGGAGVFDRQRGYLFEWSPVLYGAGIAVYFALPQEPSRLAWAGLANTYYWLDPTRRVAGVVLTQILPFADPAVLDTFGQFERAIYDSLAG